MEESELEAEREVGHETESISLAGYWELQARVLCAPNPALREPSKSPNSPSLGLESPRVTFCY